MRGTLDLVRKTWVEMFGLASDDDDPRPPRPTPLVDRRGLARARGEAIAVAFELSRGASVYDSSAGYDNTLRATLREFGCDVPRPPSADLISRLADDIRIIEVKARGGYGDVSETPERELDTMQAAGERSWLYAVYNVTQPGEYELWVVQDPGRRLTWTMTREAERPPTVARGVRHEARHTATWADVIEHGIRVDLSRVADLPVKD